MSRTEVKILRKQQRAAYKNYINKKFGDQTEAIRAQIFSDDKKLFYNKRTVKKFPEQLLKKSFLAANTATSDSEKEGAWKVAKKAYLKVHRKRNEIAKKLDMSKSQKKKLRKKTAMGRKSRLANK